MCNIENERNVFVDVQTGRQFTFPDNRTEIAASYLD